MRALLQHAEGQDRAAVAGGGRSSSPPRWFLARLARSAAKATELAAKVDAPRRSSSSQTQAALAHAVARRFASRRTISTGSRRRCPDEIDMSGILLDVNRLAAHEQADVLGRSPRRRRSLGTGYAAAAARRRCVAGPLQQRLEVPRRPPHARARPRRAARRPRPRSTRSTRSTLGSPTAGRSSRSSRRR